MTTPYRIFVADVVPLANKGEEAILRGIEDLLCQGNPVALAVFDDVPAPTQMGNITVFPRPWVYTVSGSDMPIVPRLAWLFALTVGLRAGMYGKLGRLRSRRGGRFHVLAEWFQNADLVLVGHDGVFCPESCGVLRLARAAGRRTGILGAGLSDYSVLTPVVRPLFRRAMQSAHFAVFREGHAYRFMSGLARPPGPSAVLAPDPAFAMRPAPAEEIEPLLRRLPLVAEARKGGNPWFTVTVSQKDVLLRRAFPAAASFSEKRQQHTAYLAAALAAVIDASQASLLFLPHSTEGTTRNDVVTADAVVSHMPEHNRARVAVLREDLAARTLKGIIGASDFLIGQRAHSLIGSASVRTPFAGLVASNDRRTHEILGDMCGCTDCLLDIDRLPAGAAAEAVGRLFHRRQELRRHLEERMEAFARQMRDVARLVLGSARA